MHKISLLTLAVIVGWMCVAKAATLGSDQIDDMPGSTPIIDDFPRTGSPPQFDLPKASNWRANAPTINDFPSTSIFNDFPQSTSSLTIDQAKELHRKALADAAAAQDKQDTLYCASTSLDDVVYITSEDKSVLYCAANDMNIIPCSSTNYYLAHPSCKWSKYLCITSGDNVWTYFRHYDPDNLIKYLACFKGYLGGNLVTFCWQYEIDNPGEDAGLGHIFRPDIASGYSSAKNLYNYYSEYYVKYDSSQGILNLSATAQTVFRICSAATDLIYC